MTTTFLKSAKQRTSDEVMIIQMNLMGPDLGKVILGLSLVIKSNPTMNS
jgi:hypothetical protein